MNEQSLNMQFQTMETVKTLEDVDWKPHATCPGVSLKHYITGSMTDGKFSCHLVRVQAGCEITEHIHEGSWELHEVINGKGVGELAGKVISYKAGLTVVIPQGEAHRVTATDEDIYLWAKFIPALL